MAFSLFISDLHLCDSRPEIIQAFIQFTETTARQADALYILGDLFEYWAGDDAIESGTHQESINALKALSNQQVNTFFIHGNRDFLIGHGFAQASGMTLLPDPTVVDLYGHRVLLSHGDILCTDDTDYQAFRSTVRTEAWQKEFLSQPLDDRLAYIASVRAKSDAEKSIKSMEIMDVNTQAVEQLLSMHQFPTLIHGHTHRPAKHTHSIAQHSCDRWVLGDWYEQGSYLSVDESGFHAHQL